MVNYDFTDKQQPGIEVSALFVPGPFGTDGSSDDGTTHHLERARKTGVNTGHARRDENLVKDASQ
jgi:hypothetical protein